MPLRTRTCRECSKPLAIGVKTSADFCCGDCRTVWNNRRKARGADLYDFFMNMRYNRQQAGVFGLWKMACRMAQAWKEEDDAAGRVSFASAKEIAERHVRHKATIVMRAYL